MILPAISLDVRRDAATPCSSRLSVRIPSQLYDDLCRLAAKNETSLTDITRDLLTRCVVAAKERGTL